MKYTPPIGGAANDPYVDANPATGVEGSPVPAAAIEHPQREIANVIASAGLTPDVGDQTQLYQAIQRIAGGGDYKASVTVATTAALAALSGLLTVDGIVLVAGNRVLVKDQATGAQNGIYVVAAGAWTRAIDADDGAELTSGALVPVERGTANADSLWMLQTDGAITIGTTALTFVQPLGGALAAYATKTGVQQAAYSAAAAGGTADAITATFNPTIAALTNGMTLYVRAASANATAAPTFSPNGLAAKTIVKGNNLALVDGDIAGAGHWIGLQYDSTLDKWVLTNPITLFASAAESRGFALLTKAISPGMLAEALKGANQSLAQNGYQILPGGLILQWGSLVVTANTLISVSFPIAFPNNVFGVLNSGTGLGQAATAGRQDFAATTFSQSLTGFSINQFNTTSATAYQTWFAIGR